MKTTVAVVADAAGSACPELLRALEEAYPVRFVGSTDGEIGAAKAVVVFPGGRSPERLPVPCLVLEGHGAEEDGGSSFTVEMSRHVQLDRALHGQRLMEQGRTPPAPVSVERTSRVLAVAAGRPIWTCSDVGEGGNGRERASATPSELAQHEFLRDHLTAGRFWSLLPLVHFLKRVSLGLSRDGGPRHACFIIDDPNVRFSSYGHVCFRELASEARDSGYHVAVATIPLDLVLPGRRGVRVFREHPSELSLVVHGNDHVGRELERDRSPAEADRMLGAAEARVGRFEARAGFRIERLMCPPHGGCAPGMVAALFRRGFLGLVASRPFPWDGFDDHRRWRLGGWLPGQLGGGGLPVLPRYPLGANLDDLAFRAFLGQPLIMYCHHGDLRDGLAPLRSAAARVAELGAVRWTSLASVARANATIHHDGGLATVTPFARDVRIRPPMAEAVRIEIPRIYGVCRSVRLIVDGTPHDVRVRPDVATHVTLTNPPTGDELRIRLGAQVPPRTATVRDWRPMVWPLARRAMTEGRDRSLPRIRALRT